MDTTLSADRAGLYDRLAPRYDTLHHRWLRRAGGEAQAALEASVRTVATPDQSMLDAGCGTGAFARRLQSEGLLPTDLTLLDPSANMLRRCATVPSQRVKGRLEALPFEDARFDIVTCAWALETAMDLDVAIRELTRVLRLGGVLCLAFCADKPARSNMAWLMRQSILVRGAGRFLDEDHVIRRLRNVGGFDVRSLPCQGPAAAVFVRKIAG